MPFKIKAEIRADLRDHHGKLIRRLPWKPANSLLKQFIGILTSQLSQSGITVKDTSNADFSATPASQVFGCNAGAGTTTTGVVIGTGTTAVTMTDYKLQTQVTTNITHGAVTVAPENPDANTWRSAITRVFTNNTGSTLSIKEVGLYAYYRTDGKIACIDRTLYSVDVPNGVGVTLTYRITVSL